MGLEQLCREISATAEGRAAALIKEAHESAEETLAQARSAGQKAVADARAEGEAFGAAERAERVNAAKLEEQKECSEAREEAVRRAMAQVWEQYRAQPRRPGYAKNLRRWAETAVTELGASSYVLRARGEDIKLLADAGFKVSREPLECSGGVLAETAGGKISVDCTLESLFEGKKEEAYKEVYARLFPDEGTEAAEGKSRPKARLAVRASANAAKKPAGRKSAPAKKGRASRPSGKPGKSKRGRR
ncbi:MAG: hypothetical protein KGH63_00245 [Candidatus Micrarchaeota archaeon]|nr:hypothetical protein [Candidatus Micrarchaeota archaeon]